MKKSAYPKRVILAVDLKAEEPKLTEKLWSALAPLLKNADVVVEPVTILNREDAALGNYLQNRIGKLRPATERHLADQLTEMGLKGFAPPKVLFADGSSNQRAVMALLKHAKKTGCDLIAVSSHSRRGVDRFFLGSFAETLSLQSPIPLLTVNPKQRLPSGKSKSILFPTDFSEKSKEALGIVCNSFSGAKQKLVLFHSLQYRNYVYGAEGYSMLPERVFQEDKERAERLGREWCEELRNKGFSCVFLLDEKSPSVAEGIFSAAKKQKVAMVALVSKTGKWGTRLLGSVTRQVLRGSPCPVWVVHPLEEAGKGKVGVLRKSAGVKRRGIASMPSSAAH